MLDKVLSILRKVTSKNGLRAGLALTAAVTVITGLTVLDRPQVVYGDSVYSVDAVYDNATVNIDTVDVVESTVVEGTVTADSVEGPMLTLTDDGEYTLSPISIKTTYETVTETVKFGYKTVYSDELYKGESKTTKGQNGEKKVVYRVETVNGVVITREVESEEVTKEAVPQTETVGTKLHSADAVMTSDDVKCISTLTPDEPIELDKNGIPVNYTKVITGKATAYCGKCDNSTTAVGLPAQPGLVAVDFSKIPKFTKMYIVCDDGTVYGYSMAADTGGFVKNGNTLVDLRMPTGSSCNCNSFGRKNVTIYILE